MENTLYVFDLPYFENGNLKIKHNVYPLQPPVMRRYEYDSIDITSRRKLKMIRKTEFIRVPSKHSIVKYFTFADLVDIDELCHYLLGREYLDVKNGHIELILVPEARDLVEKEFVRKLKAKAPDFETLPHRVVDAYNEHPVARCYNLTFTD